MSVVHWVTENWILMQDIPISDKVCELDFKSPFALNFLSNWIYNVFHWLWSEKYKNINK